MKQIKFSHLYKKIPLDVFKDRKAKLIEMFTIDYNNLSTDFKIYDTCYVTKNNDEYYSLPKTKLIVLLLLKNGNLFTTIRRYTPQKYTYYYTSIGEEFEIVFPSTQADKKSVS